MHTEVVLTRLCCTSSFRVCCKWLCLPWFVYTHSALCFTHAPVFFFCFFSKSFLQMGLTVTLSAFGTMKSLIPELLKRIILRCLSATMLPDVTARMFVARILDTTFQTFPPWSEKSAFVNILKQVRNCAHFFKLCCIWLLISDIWRGKSEENAPSTRNSYSGTRVSKPEFGKWRHSNMTA